MANIEAANPISKLKLEHLEWDPNLGSGFKYELDEYWESNKEDPFITTVLTDTANWTTHLVLDVYKYHFPWTWLRTQFGIDGEKQDFMQLMESQAVITVPSVLLVLFGLMTIGVTAYLRKRQNMVITVAELEKQKYYWKQAISISLVLTCFFVGFSSVQLMQAAEPVIKQGAFTLSNVTLSTLNDLENYRKILIAENHYFFTSYIQDNFGSLYNLNGMIAQVAQMLALAYANERHKAFHQQLKGHSKHLMLLRKNIFGIQNETVQMLKSFRRNMDAIDTEIQSYQDLCTSLGLTQCQNMTANIASVIELPTTEALDDVAVHLKEVDVEFQSLDLDKFSKWVDEIEVLLQQYMVASPIGMSLKDIKITLKRQSLNIKQSYGIQEGLPVTEDFAEHPRELWTKVRSIQQTYRLWVYAAFILFVGSSVIYAIVTVTTFAIAYLQIKHYDFPTYIRPKLTTHSADIIFRISTINIILMVPLTIMAPLSLIGGSFATVLAESVQSREIFDKVIHGAPALNQTFSIKGQPLNVTNLKDTLSACEKEDTGILKAMKAQLPLISFDLTRDIPPSNSVTNYISAMVNTLALLPARKTEQPGVHEFIALDLPTLINLHNVTEAKLPEKDFLTKRSTEYSDLSEEFSALASTTQDDNLRTQYTTLSTTCASISTKFTSLNTQFDENDKMLAILRIDIEKMIEYYNGSQNSLRDAIAGMDELAMDLKNFQDQEAISQHLLDRLIEVADVFEPISLAVLLSNLGKCGHLAYIYETISYICYFAAVRYVNVIWVSLIAFSVSLGLAGIHNVLIYRYFCPYEGIKYTSEEQRMKARSAASVVRLTRRKRSSEQDRPRSIHKSIRSTARFSLNSRMGSNITSAARRGVVSRVVQKAQSVESVFKSLYELPKGVKLIPQDQISQISLILNLSECSTPLIMPSETDYPVTEETFYQSNMEVRRFTRCSEPTKPAVSVSEIELDMLDIPPKPKAVRSKSFHEYSCFGEGKSCGTFRTTLSRQTGASLLAELQADKYAISGKDVAIFDEDDGVNEEIGLYKTESSHHSKNSGN